MNGVINIYKEKGFTSQDVVAKLKGILKQKRIGHTGTLDPDAEGVLPICIGNATKLFDILTDRTKEYEAAMLLGKTTDTQDISGKVIKESGAWRDLNTDEIISVIKGFMPGYEQIPPMYSALKVGGKKLYELAREGIEVERKPRYVEIDNIDIVDITLPRIIMRMSVSKGTYIRTICNDIGDKLNCGGTMESLIRTRSGSFTIKDALKLSDVEAVRDEGRLEKIIQSVDSLFDYEKIHMKSKSDKALHNGNVFFINDTIEKKACERALVYDSEGLFCGIYDYSESEGKFKPYKMFL